MSAIRVRNLTKRFGSTVAVDDVGFDLERGKVLGVLGPSGCGKTTLLRSIAGLEKPERGLIQVDELPLFDAGSVDVPVERRGIGFVFQDYALFPHLTVEGNVGYGVRDKAMRARRVREALELVGLGGFEGRRVGELSGGQQQRVALARSLAPEPKLLLLDEPFSNLDADLRIRVRHEVREILRAAGTTAIFVTHDQEEAFEVSDLVAVMSEGHVEQYGTPEDVYHTPSTLFVADFVGQATLVPATATETTVTSELGTFDAAGLPPGPIELLLRPEDVDIEPGEGATIVWRRFQGSQNLYLARTDAGAEVLSVGSSQVVHHPGDRVRLRFRPDHLVVFRGSERLAAVNLRARTGTDV